jgi:hypothetical protein
MFRRAHRRVDATHGDAGELALPPSLPPSFPPFPDLADCLFRRAHRGVSGCNARECWWTSQRKRKRQMHIVTVER